MLQYLRNFIDRIKAMFLADIALDLESQIVSRDAERQAQLLRQAEGYQKEGLSEVADRLRQRIQAIDAKRAMESALPGKSFGKPLFHCRHPV